MKGPPRFSSLVVTVNDSKPFASETRGGEGSSELWSLLLPRDILRPKIIFKTVFIHSIFDQPYLTRLGRLSVGITLPRLNVRD